MTIHRALQCFLGMAAPLPGRRGVPLAILGAFLFWLAAVASPCMGQPAPAPASAARANRNIDVAGGYQPGKAGVPLRD